MVVETGIPPQYLQDCSLEMFNTIVAYMGWRNERQAKAMSAASKKRRR